MNKTLEKAQQRKERLEERVNALEKNVTYLKEENVILSKTISTKEGELKRLNELRNRERLEFETQGRQSSMIRK